MSKTLQLLRKALVLLIGGPLIIIGIILVPLPGPGLLIMFAGLFLISLEFDGAKKYVEQIKHKLGMMYKKAQRRADALADKADAKTSKGPK